jgi:hypothetical protein
MKISEGSNVKIFENRGIKIAQNKIRDQNCAKQNRGTKIAHFIK